MRKQFFEMLLDLQRGLTKPQSGQTDHASRLRADEGMLRLLDQTRFHALKFLYDIFFAIMIRDASWQKPLFESIAPEANSRVLNFGPGSVSSTRTLALRFPEVSFVGVDPNRKAVEKARQGIVGRGTPNLTVVEAPR